jgi:GTP pyrophosphokinase
MKSASPPVKLSVFENSDRDRILKVFEELETHAVGEQALGVVPILVDLGLDADAVIAALVLSYNPQAAESASIFPTAYKWEDGSDAARLVNGALRIGSLPVNSKTIHEAHNIRNMIFAMTDDIRVIIICLALKLHALRMLDSSPEPVASSGQAKAIARECLDIYAPLADRLGISWLKDEMEDLCLKFTNREAYQQIDEIVSLKREQRDELLKASRETIMTEAAAAGINVEVKSRAKHFYSVYMKMRKRGKSADEIFDLYAIRVICDSIENCYTLLGLVHRLWEPIKGCFDDYIAKPKPNGYRSLHTAVMAGADLPGLNGEEGRLEIQIRTVEMDQIAENGVASHWLYKKGSSRDMVRPEDINVVNRLKQWKDDRQAVQSYGGSTGSWLEEIKNNILRDSIYTLTPQGRVIKLPAGATPLDFAYQVHTAIGEHCMGAKTNGSIIPLNSELKNTQVVEILTSQSAHPHAGWLEMTKTSKARGKIRAWLEQNDAAFIAEKNAVEKKKPVVEAPVVPAVADTATGNEEPFVQRVVQPFKSALQVRIEDEKNLLVRFARCCNPVAGDPITVYVSRGRGIIIHRKNCANLVNISEFQKRQIEAEWENADSSLIKRFRIEARRQANLFSEIEGAIRRRQGHLIDGRLEESHKEAANRLTGLFTIQLTNADDLKPVMKNIRGVPGILGIQQLN